MAKKSDNNFKELFSDKVFEIAESNYNLFRNEAIRHVMAEKRSVVIEQFLIYCNISDPVRGYTIFWNLFHAQDMNGFVMLAFRDMLEKGFITAEDGLKFTSGELYEIDDEIRRRCLQNWSNSLKVHLKSSHEMVSIDFLMNAFHVEYKKSVDDKDSYNSFVGEMSQALNSARLEVLGKRKGVGGPKVNLISLKDLLGWNGLKESIIQNSTGSGNNFNQFIVASLYHLVITKSIDGDSFINVTDNIIAKQLADEFKGSADSYRRALGKMRQTYGTLDTPHERLKKHHLEILGDYPDLHFVKKR